MRKKIKNKDDDNDNLNDDSFIQVKYMGYLYYFFSLGK